MAQLTMDKLVNLAKGRGFVYAGSEIYGGLSNSWGLRSVGRGNEKQHQTGVVQKICQGKSPERRHRHCNFNESQSVGSKRTPWRILRPADGLQKLQNSLPVPTISLRITKQSTICLLR